MKTKDWFLFCLLGLMWGTSFLWIKIAVADVSPLVLVGLRTLFASIGSGIIIFLNRESMPAWKDLKKRLFDFLVLGIFNIAFPWVLISWGEQFVESGIASILNSTTPLYTIIIAPLMIKDEHFTLSKGIGLIGGFIGVVVLMLPSIQKGWNQNLFGQAAILLAAFLYGFSAVFARKKGQGLPPQLQSFLQLFIGSAIIWGIIFATEGTPVMPSLPITWIALLWLGLIGSCFAYIIYFHLLHKIGATRTSLVTYIPPLVGVLLGLIFLSETFYWQSILGALLILSGIYWVNQGDKIIPPAGK